MKFDGEFKKVPGFEDYLYLIFEFNIKKLSAALLVTSLHWMDAIGMMTLSRRVI